MNYLDYFICIPLIWGAYKGFGKGLLFEIALIVALIAGVYGAVKFANRSHSYLQHRWHVSDSLLPFVSFLAVFAAIVIVILLAAKLLELAIKPTPLSLLNRIGGTLLGVLKWTFIISSIFYVLGPIDTQYHLINEQTKEKSVLYEPVCKFAAAVMPVIREKMKQQTESIKISE